MKDLFVSHASEDKKDFVRPLVITLKNMGVDVWYDEFSIKPGDSISESLDKGLIECNYGLIILSPDFLNKRWTEYELKSLISKEVYKGKTIIPIWYHVNYEMIANRSLYLADKNALMGNMGIPRLAFEIIKIVRPDIINSNLHRSMMKKLQPSKESEKVPISSIKKGPIIHKKMPPHLLLAAKIITSIFAELSSFEEFVDNLSRDYDYDQEFLLWSVFAATYAEIINANGVLPTIEEKNRIVSILLYLSIADYDRINTVEISESLKQQVCSAYYDNLKLLYPIINPEGTKE